MNLQGQIGESGAHAQNHRLELLSASGVCDVRGEVLFEDSFVSGVPCALDEVTHRSHAISTCVPLVRTTGAS